VIRIEQKTALNSGFLLLCGAQHCFIAIYGIQKLATERELSDFLIQVERRAFKQAVFAVHDDHAALDIVQDAMMRLAEKYGTRPVDELPMLFQRILQNAIKQARIMALIPFIQK